MTAADHGRWPELLAAHVLGALEPADRAELEAHLATCGACRSELVALAPIPALLGRVDVAELDGLPPDAGPVVRAVLAERDGLQRSRRRWRWLAAAAAVAAIVAGGVGVATAVDGDQPAPSAEGVALAVHPAVDGADVDVVAEERAWGTYLHVATGTLPERDAYVVWTVDDAGAWERAGSWGPTDGDAYLGCSTSLSLEDLDRVVVTSQRRSDVLLVAR